MSAIILRRRPVLTKRQQQVLDVIESLTVRNQRPPTTREIGVVLKIRSPNGVRCHLLALRKKGYLAEVKARKSHATTTLVDSPWSFPYLGEVS